MAPGRGRTSTKETEEMKREVEDVKQDAVKGLLTSLLGDNMTDEQAHVLTKACLLAKDNLGNSSSSSNENMSEVTATKKDEKIQTEKETKQESGPEERKHESPTEEMKPDVTITKGVPEGWPYNAGSSAVWHIKTLCWQAPEQWCRECASGRECSAGWEMCKNNYMDYQESVMARQSADRKRDDDEERISCKTLEMSSKEETGRETKELLERQETMSATLAASRDLYLEATEKSNATRADQRQQQCDEARHPLMKSLVASRTVRCRAPARSPVIRNLVARAPVTCAASIAQSSSTSSNWPRSLSPPVDPTMEAASHEKEKSPTSTWWDNACERWPKGVIMSKDDGGPRTPTPNEGGQM
jgi:hypothetical protein